MARKQRTPGWPRSESHLRANRETRGGRVLKVWRRVQEDHSSLLGGAVSELVHDASIPPVKLTTKLDAYVFDPRLMPRNFNDGFLSGYQFGRVVSDIERTEHISETGYPVRLGKLALLGNRKTIIAELDSDRLSRERNELYAILALAGVKGFTEQGHRRGRRDGTPPTIAIGNFAQPLAKTQEAEYLEALQTAIEVNLASSSGDMELDLGPLQVKAYQPD